MASNLKTYASSSFGLMSKYMSSRAKKSKVHVYVEDDLDKAFWRVFLSEHDKEHTFIVSLYHTPTSDAIPGKDAMLKAVKAGTLKLSPYQLCCVDADYDLIIDVPGKYSSIVRNNIYVIHTAWYSMENIKCEPLGSLGKIAYKTSLPDDEITYDFKTTIEDISELLSELFIVTILAKESLDTELSIDDLKTLVRDNLTFTQKIEISDDFKKAVSAKEKDLLAYCTKNKEGLDAIKTRLSDMGYTPRTYYRIMQGHMLIDDIVSPLIECVSEPIRKAYFSSLSGTKEQKEQGRAHYENNTGAGKDVSLRQRILSLLRDNYDFAGLSISENIKWQVNRALQPREELLDIVKTLAQRAERVTGTGTA